MKSQKIILAFFLALIALGLSSPMVLAGDVDDRIDDGWLTFSWNPDGVYGCKPADPDGLPCAPMVGSIPADAPPWTFTAPEHGVMLTVVDTAVSGDQFQILDFDNIIGSTSDSQQGSSCSNDPSICLSNPAMSSGAFYFEAGEHSLTIAMLKNPFNFGAACFRLERATPGLMQILDLIEAVEKLALEGKLGDSQAQALVKLLGKTLEKLNLWKISSGCSKLEDFVFEVTDLIDNDVLSVDDGEPLIDSVYQIQESLDCLSFQGE